MANGSASLHCAGDGRHWLNRVFIYAVFDWCFNQLGLKVLINTVASGNEDSLRFTKHIGFTEFARFPGAWDGEQDLVLFSMRREDCHWLERLQNGQQKIT
jgi:RimJ/RimL family protein N-acetyltransferase